MPLRGHTCGMSGPVPGTPQRSARLRPKREGRRGQGRAEEIPNTWDGRSG